MSANAFLTRRRWTLWKDRLVLESQDLLYGYSPEALIHFRNVSKVYLYRRARPVNLLLGLFGVPLLIAAVAIFAKSDVAGSILGAAGLAITAYACLSGFVPRPHIMIEHTHGRHEFVMSGIFLTSSTRLEFRSALAECLQVPAIVGRD